MVGRQPALRILHVGAAAALLLIASLAAQWPSPCVAEPPARSSAPKLSLPQAVAIALNRNHNMTLANLEVKRKEHQRRVAFSDFFPSIELEYTAEADRYDNLTNIEYLSYAQDSRWYERTIGGTTIVPAEPYRINTHQSFSLSATLTQPIFSGGKLLNEYKRAKLGAKAARIQRKLDMQDLTLEVHKAFYHLVLSHKLLGTTTKSVKALDANLKQSMAFHRAGIVLEVDVLAGSGQLAKARISQRKAAKAIERYRAGLNFLLRYPPNAPTQVIRNLTFKRTSYGIPQIFTIAVRNRLEIVKANMTAQEAMAAVKVAQARLLPSLDLEVVGTRTNDDWNVLDREAYNDWTLKGVLTWTFDMYGRREKVKRDRVAYAKKFVDKQLLVQQIMEEVQTAFIAMKQSEEDIPDTKIALDAFLANYRKNVALYKQQLATYREVLDAEKDAAQAAAAYYTALAKCVINRSTLERKMGILR